MRKVMNIIVLSLVGAGALCGLGFAGYQYVAGEGEMTVIAPADSELTVSIDKGAPQKVNRGQHYTFKLKKGTHGIEFESAYGKSEKPVLIDNGFQNLLVPSDKDQCFVVLDVSRSFYKFSGRTAEKYPRIVKKVTPDQPYDLPGSIYYTEASLPSSIKEDASANLVQEVADCAVFTKGDDELFKSLGFD